MIFYGTKTSRISYSSSEGLSIAIIEYLAMSCAVIVSNVGGTPEIITHNVDGLLVDSHNLDELEQGDSQTRYATSMPQGFGPSGTFQSTTAFQS